MMWKHIFILVILAHFGFCRYSLEERLQGESTASQHCVEVCHDDCTYCVEPQRCTDLEDKCGEEPPKRHPNCSPDDICVPAGCECEKTGTNGVKCPQRCPCSCNDDEICCPGKTLSNGCIENDYCHPKGAANDDVECPGYCPVECKNSEMLCPSPNDPSTGCEVQPMCVPKQTTNWGTYCSHQECPLVCDETETLCVGSIDYKGCKEADICVLRGTSNSGDLCPGTCPVECEDHEILCKGQIDYGNGTTGGCIGQDECKAKAKDLNGEYCPDNSYSHDCPVTCPNDEVLCPPGRDSVGCLLEAKCYPRSKDNNDNYCPSTSDCPVICGPGEFSCPAGTDENGCSLPECVPQARDFYGELCTAQCPPVCKDDEIFCPGPWNDVGCLEPSVCLKRDTKIKGNDKGALCPGWCKPVCKHDEIKCPSLADPCDGCPAEERCVPIALDFNKMACPGANYPLEPLSASHNCAKPCEDSDGYVLCAAHIKLNGCKPEALCRPLARDNDGEWCPRHSVCPEYCKGGEWICDYGKDPRGCKMATACITRQLDKDGELCPGFCPPQCERGQAHQPAGIDAKGCIMPPVCQDIAGYSDDNSDVHCSQWSYLNCDASPGGECNLGGVYSPRQWKPDLQAATDWCLLNSDCSGIVRDNGGFEPRKGPGINANPDAHEIWWCFNNHLH